MSDCCSNHENHNHEEELEESVFSLKDENGEEQFFALLDEYEKNGKKYWICEEVKVENGQIVENTSSEEFYITLFAAEEDEEGNMALGDVESEEEFQEIIDEWELTSDKAVFYEDDPIDEDDSIEEDEEEEEEKE